MVIITIIWSILYLVIKGLIATNALYFRFSSTVEIRLAAAAGYVTRPLLQGNNVPSITTIHIFTKLRQEREREKELKKERERERKRKKERERKREKKRKIEKERKRDREKER